MKTLELELSGWVYQTVFIEYEVWARGDERILYDVKAELIHLHYNKNDDISKYIKE